MSSRQIVKKAAQTIKLLKEFIHKNINQELIDQFYAEMHNESKHLAHTDVSYVSISVALIKQISTFEVQWFEPTYYLDPETRELLEQSIRETHRFDSHLGFK